MFGARLPGVLKRNGAQSGERDEEHAGRIGERRDWLRHRERPVAVVVTRTRPEEGEVGVSALARRELFWAEKIFLGDGERDGLARRRVRVLSGAGCRRR